MMVYMIQFGQGNKPTPVGQKLPIEGCLISSPRKNGGVNEAESADYVQSVK